ncbi:MAG: SPOR domain-containing protein [Proteobacteria bacterium]|nr:SPOR domain-containing protein [Pseudomonadota bacterium]
MALPGGKEIKVTASDALEFEPVVPEPPKRRLGWKVFVFLAVAAVAGSWSYYGDQLIRLWGGGQGGIPLIKADPGPIKVRPENPGGLRVPYRDKLVYDRMQGQSAGPGDAGDASGGAERLLPPPEQPLPRPAPKKEVAKETPKTKPVPEVPTVKDVAAAKRPPPPPPPQAPQASSTAASRETRTTAPAPVKAKRESEPKAEKLNPLAESPKPAAEPAPKPEPRQAAAPKPAPQPAPKAAPEPASSAPAPIPSRRAYLVQLAAARSPQGARSEWERLRKKHRDLLGKLGLAVTKADLGAAKGIYYRLRAGPLADEKAARRLCQQLAKRQVGCLIIKPVR